MGFTKHECCTSVHFSGMISIRLETCKPFSSSQTTTAYKHKDAQYCIWTQYTVRTDTGRTVLARRQWMRHDKWNSMHPMSLYRYIYRIEIYNGWIGWRYLFVGCECWPQQPTQICKYLTILYMYLDWGESIVSTCYGMLWSCFNEGKSKHNKPNTRIHIRNTSAHPHRTQLLQLTCGFKRTISLCFWQKLIRVYRYCGY